MRGETEHLIEQWLEGSLDEASHDALADWLREHPEHMQQFTQASVREQMLLDAARGELVASEVQEIAPIPIDSAKPFLSREIAYVAAVAACVTIAALWFVTADRGVSPAQAFSSVAFVRDANSNLKAGDRLGEGTVRIDSGFIRLLFDDGVEVTLQGPAEYELIGPGKTRLHSGLLTATVPQGAQGFEVKTATAQVIDLGTSFGIEQDENGLSRVSVFDGKVEVVGQRQRHKRLLTEGEAVQLDSKGIMSDVALEPKRFEKVWPIASGIVGSTEGFRFLPPWPKRIRFIQSDDDIFVAAEGYAVELTEPLQLNISDPGEYERVDDLTPLTLPAGERVRSYILHYSPTRSLPPARARRMSGSITFDRPILGLIVQHEQLLASMRRFGPRRAREFQQRRQLDLTGAISSDRVALSPDRRMVTLDVISPGRNTDLVRVIVDSSSPSRTPSPEFR